MIELPLTEVRPVRDSRSEADRAEAWQSIKALFIPLSLFLACLASAAGTFLVYNQEPVGWFFLAGAAAVITAALIGLIRFQNKYRANGLLVGDERLDTESEDDQALRTTALTVGRKK